jgi:hypothetical protein
MKFYSQDFFQQVYKRLLETGQGFLYLPDGEIIDRETCEKELVPEERDKIFQEWGCKNIPF